MTSLKVTTALSSNDGCVSSVQVRVARELQREHSFPGQFSGALTKTEARRRLLSWKRTTIARKNSEQQY